MFLYSVFVFVCVCVCSYRKHSFISEQAHEINNNRTVIKVTRLTIPALTTLTTMAFVDDHGNGIKCVCGTLHAISVLCVRCCVCDVLPAMMIY